MQHYSICILKHIYHFTCNLKIATFVFHAVLTELLRKRSNKEIRQNLKKKKLKLKYYTVGRVPKYNRKIITNTHTCSLTYLTWYRYFNNNKKKCWC